MARGINRQLIFEEQEDYLKYLSILSEVKQASGFKLYAYCLLGNHVHLLLETGTEPLSQVFRRVGSRYVFWFNLKYGRSGHLFQDRFKSEPVESDGYFMTVLAYIYQNPVMAGVCKMPEDYQWSSRKLLGKNKLIDEDALFSIIPLKDIKDRERVEIPKELLEPETGRRVAMSDDEALMKMRSLSGARSATEFQSFGKEAQAKVIHSLFLEGASLRQLVRVTGLGRKLITRICQK